MNNPLTTFPSQRHSAHFQGRDGDGHADAGGDDRTRPVASAQPMLELAEVSTHYGRIQVLHDLDLRIDAGETVALVGANGAGKSTLLRVISGLQPLSGGALRFNGRDLTRRAAADRVGDGIVQVPEGRQVFAGLSVEDNLKLGAFRRRRDPSVAGDLDAQYQRFPILKDKRRELAGNLSGGQQQMLAMARALMANPKLLLLDEPSMGLAPLIVEEIFNIIGELKKEGITLFVVEQNAAEALAIADRGYVLETGHLVASGSGRELLDNDSVKAAYLGG